VRPRLPVAADAASELNIKGTWAKEDTPFGYDFW
jgi:hypothetical protein